MIDSLQGRWGLWFAAAVCCAAATRSTVSNAADQGGASALTRAGNPVGRHRLFLAVDIGYTPPLIDMDNYNGGGLLFGAGAAYSPVDTIYLGLRTRYEHLLIGTDADLKVNFIDIQAVIGAYLIAGLHPYLAVGVTAAGTIAYGDAHYDPNFAGAVGANYTFWLDQIQGLGIEVGAELAAMVNEGFQRTGTQSGVAADYWFLQLMALAGMRYSLLLKE